MADILITLIKSRRSLTEELAKELQAQGFTVWWDKSAVADEALADMLQAELAQARAVIVIWAAGIENIESLYLKSVATEASRRNVLISVRDDTFPHDKVPIPFNDPHPDVLSNRSAILARLSELKVAPRGHAGPQSQHATVASNFRRRLLLPTFAALAFFALAGALIDWLATGRDMKSSLAPAQSFVLASGTYDGKSRTTLQYGGLAVLADRRPSPNGFGHLPIVTIRVQNRDVLTFHIGDGGLDEPAAQILVARLDPATNLPQVVATSFSGGAHCCTMTTIATVANSGMWQTITAETLDGGGYEFLDLDADGTGKLLNRDNSFLYRFGCYACSYTPTRIAKLSGAQLQDVTRERKYQEFHRTKLREMEASARDNNTRRSTGYLAGWVAQKALLGELEGAWLTMLASYEPNWIYEQCLVDIPLNECPDNKRGQTSFPKALSRHLVEHGYITSEEARRLGKST